MAKQRLTYEEFEKFSWEEQEANKNLLAVNYFDSLPKKEKNILKEKYGKIIFNKSLCFHSIGNSLLKIDSIFHYGINSKNFSATVDSIVRERKNQILIKKHGYKKFKPAKSIKVACNYGISRNGGKYVSVVLSPATISLGEYFSDKKKCINQEIIDKSGFLFSDNYAKDVFVSSDYSRAGFAWSKYCTSGVTFILKNQVPKDINSYNDKLKKDGQNAGYYDELHVRETIQPEDFVGLMVNKEELNKPIKNLEVFKNTYPVQYPHVTKEFIQSMKGQFNLGPNVMESLLLYLSSEISKQHTTAAYRKIYYKSKYAHGLGDDDIYFGKKLFPKKLLQNSISKVYGKYLDKKEPTLKDILYYYQKKYNLDLPIYHLDGKEIEVDYSNCIYNDKKVINREMEADIRKDIDEDIKYQKDNFYKELDIELDNGQNNKIINKTKNTQIKNFEKEEKINDLNG